MSEIINENPWGVGTVSEPKTRRYIYPMPKSIHWGTGTLELKLKTHLRIAVGCSDETKKTIQDIWQNFTSEQGILELAEDSNLPANSFASRGKKVPVLKMSYSVSIDTQGIGGIAASEKDLLYAWFTFVQLLHPNNDTIELEYMKLPYVEICDKPDIEFRGIHFCVFPETTFEMLERL